jgi:hypothetical protein
MNTDNRAFLKKTLQSAVPSTLLLAKYLQDLGVSRNLQQ